MFSMYANTKVHAMITPGGAPDRHFLFLKRDDGYWELPNTTMLAREARIDTLDRLIKSRTGLIVPFDHISEPVNFPPLPSPFWMHGHYERHEYFTVTAKVYEISFADEVRHAWRTPKEAVEELRIVGELADALPYVATPV